jgi:dolichol-phosphate mannosyltransferase
MEITDDKSSYVNPEVTITASTKKIAVVIPAKNEAHGIGKLIQSLYEQKYKQIVDKQIVDKVIVIDGKSTDRTREIAEYLGAKVVEGEGKGKGHDFRLFQDCIRKNPQDFNFDIFVMIDGDGSYKPEDIEKLIESIKNNEADVVLGSRFYGIKPEPGSIRKLNRFGNSLLALVAKVLYRRIDLTDVTSGYWAFSKDFLTTAYLSAKGFDLEVNILDTAIRYYHFKVISINYGNREGYSKINLLKDPYKILKNLFKYFALSTLRK